jgi:hypothetical protein
LHLLEVRGRSHRFRSALLARSFNQFGEKGTLRLLSVCFFLSNGGTLLRFSLHAIADRRCSASPLIVEHRIFIKKPDQWILVNEIFSFNSGVRNPPFALQISAMNSSDIFPSSKMRLVFGRRRISF